MEEKLEAVALGHGLALVPATAAAYYQRPDITYRPVTGAQPYQVALATTTETAARPEVQAFVKTALAATVPPSGQEGIAARASRSIARERWHHSSTGPR
jgi:DNA-binding transcriptional LysR family regulator